MLTIDLSNDQNQSFTTTLESDEYVIALYQVGLSMVCDVNRNQTQIVSAGKIAGSEFILPHPYQFIGHGNFMLITKNFELPDLNLFGITQYLMYYTIAEMQQVLAGQSIT